MNTQSRALMRKIKTKEAAIGVVGLGYVGLPLVKAFLNKGFKVTGFDVDRKKVRLLNKGQSYIKHVTATELKKYLAVRRFEATDDFSRLKEMDAILICVPTPLDAHQIGRAHV